MASDPPAAVLKRRLSSSVSPHHLPRGEVSPVNRPRVSSPLALMRQNSSGGWRRDWRAERCLRPSALSGERVIVCDSVCVIVCDCVCVCVCVRVLAR